MSKYGIINSKNQIFEYEANTVVEAIDKYIEEELDYERGFSMSKDMWLDRIKGKVTTDTDALVTLVNGLCRHNKQDITKVISGYNTDYSIT